MPRKNNYQNFHAKRKKMYRKNYGNYKISRSLVSPNKVYRFVQTVYPPAANWTYNGDALAPFVPNNGNYTRLAQSNSIATGFNNFGLYFTLNDIANASPFETIFDQYRIELVELDIFPATSGMVGNNSASSTGASAPPLFWQHAVDYDDASVTGYVGNTLDQFNTCKLHPVGGALGGKKTTIRFKPVIAMSGYAGAFTAYVQGAKNQWLDMANGNTRYYGFKCAFNSTPNLTYGVSALDVKLRYVIAFKNLK